MSGFTTYNGYQLPAYQPPVYAYASVLIHGNQAWVSGSVPKTGKDDLYPGKVGKDVTLEQAKEAAELAALNALSSLSYAIGGLDNLEQMLMLRVYVASAPGFIHQPHVADAVSNLLQSILGDRGRHARTAIGVAELPRNSSVEVDLTAAVRPK